MVGLSEVSSLEASMKFVIQRVDGAFVADMRKSTTGSSYTKNVMLAQLFDSKETAQANCCDNERPVSLDSLFEGGCR
jgi:hypothetical protein